MLCVLLCVTLCPFWFSIRLDREEGACCFGLFVLLVSRDCCVALPHDATGFFLQFVIVLFPDHTHLLFLSILMGLSYCHCFHRLDIFGVNKKLDFSSFQNINFSKYFQFECVL